jgi:NAD(P)-dependent dehydrogenase (short-subunit alcohol dehydrogenase family)
MSHTHPKGSSRMDISGKTAIVTGAASGIGLGIATALAEAGANVVMADIQKDAVEQAAHASLALTSALCQ